MIKGSTLATKRVQGQSGLPEILLFPTTSMVAQQLSVLHSQQGGLLAR